MLDDINLETNELGKDNGFKAITDALLVNDTVRKVHLSNNIDGIDDGGDEGESTTWSQSPCSSVSLLSSEVSMSIPAPSPNTVAHADPERKFRFSFRYQ